MTKWFARTSHRTFLFFRWTLTTRGARDLCECLGRKIVCRLLTRVCFRVVSGLCKLKTLGSNMGNAEEMGNGALGPSLGAIVSAVAVVPSAFANYPVARVIAIRQAQGALPGYTYTNVFRCLYQMPAQQGGLRQVWRGFIPHLMAKTLTAPTTFVVHGALERLSMFQRPRSGASRSTQVATHFARGAIAGGFVSLVTYPLQMVSLRLQIDVGGGTNGPRTFPSGDSLSVSRRIARKAGVFSAPFSTTGGLYRGWVGGLLGAMINRGVYFGMYDSARGSVASFGFLGKFALGLGVTNAATWVSYPFRVGVVRAQAAVAPSSSFNGVASKVAYKGALDAMFKVASAEGIGALWRGYGLNLALSLGGAFMLVSYDYAKFNFFN